MNLYRSLKHGRFDARFRPHRHRTFHPAGPECDHHRDTCSHTVKGVLREMPEGNSLRWYGWRTRQSPQAVQPAAPEEEDSDVASTSTRQPPASGGIRATTLSRLEPRIQRSGSSACWREESKHSNKESDQVQRRQQVLYPATSCHRKQPA